MADRLGTEISLATGQVEEIPVDFWASAVAPDEPTGTVWVLRQNRHLACPDQTS